MLTDSQWVDFPRIADARGNLTFIEKAVGLLRNSEGSFIFLRAYCIAKDKRKFHALIFFKAFVKSATILVELIEATAKTECQKKWLMGA